MDDHKANLQTRISQAQHDAAILHSTMEELISKLNKQDENKLDGTAKGHERLRLIVQKYEQGTKKRQQVQVNIREGVQQEQQDFVQEIRAAESYYQDKFGAYIQELRQAAGECHTLVESHVISHNHMVDENQEYPPKLQQQIQFVKANVGNLRDELMDFRNTIITKTYETLPWDNYVKSFAQINLHNIEQQYQQLDKEAEDQKLAALNKLKLVQERYLKQNNKRTELIDMYKQKGISASRKLRSLQKQIKKEANLLQLRLYVSGSRITRYSSTDADGQ